MDETATMVPPPPNVVRDCHLGEYDHVTGEQFKPADLTRGIEP
jgi:hypothetical protein